MSKKDLDIKKGFQELIKVPMQAFPATVTAVDEAACTCDIEISEGVEIGEVRLRAALDEDNTNNGLVIIPKLQSVVFVARLLNSDTLYVAMFSEIEKVLFKSSDVNIKIDVVAKNVNFKINTAEFNQTANGFKIIKGSSGLKKTLTDLITAIKAITVPTGVGPSGTPVNFAAFDNINTDLANYLE